MLRTAIVVLAATSLAFAADPSVIESKHMRVTLSQAPARSNPHKKYTLRAEIELAPGMHVYAPTVDKPYLPISLAFPSGQAKLRLGSVKFPEAKRLHLEAIDETVPVYTGAFAITVDVTLKDPKADADVQAELKYQTCDDRICYRPATLPLTWHIEPRR